MPQQTPEDIPHITGECANCHMIFDLKYTLACPRCRGEHLAWALNQTQADEFLNPYPHILIESGESCRWDCIACKWSKERREQEKRNMPAIAECYRLYALNDPRPDKPDNGLIELERLYKLEDDRGKTDA